MIMLLLLLFCFLLLIYLADSQMSTHVPGFQSFLRGFFASFSLDKLATSGIRVNPFHSEATYVQGTTRQTVRKQAKSCHVGIYWKVLVEYYQMSTDILGF